MVRSPRRSSVGLLALVLALGSPLASRAQDVRASRSDERMRVGISIGGTGFLGLVTEYQWGDWAAELTVGTITFRDISLALAGKRYFSSGDLRPAVGVGLWSLLAWTEEGSGSVLIFRLPVAVDWTFLGGHAIGLELGLNRALAVDRLDPEDDTPPSSRIIPFPGMYYRYGWAP